MRQGSFNKMRDVVIHVTVHTENDNLHIGFINKAAGRKILKKGNIIIRVPDPDKHIYSAGSEHILDVHALRKKYKIKIVSMKDYRSTGISGVYCGFQVIRELKRDNSLMTVP